MQHICLQCGIEFKGKRTQKFHSLACSERWARDHPGEVAIPLEAPREPAQEVQVTPRRDTS